MVQLGQSVRDAWVGAEKFEKFGKFSEKSQIFGIFDTFDRCSVVTGDDRWNLGELFYSKLLCSVLSFSDKENSKTLNIFGFA